MLHSLSADALGLPVGLRFTLVALVTLIVRVSLVALVVLVTLVV